MSAPAVQQARVCRKTVCYNIMHAAGSHVLVATVRSYKNKCMTPCTGLGLPGLWPSHCTCSGPHVHACKEVWATKCGQVWAANASWGKGQLAFNCWRAAVFTCTYICISFSLMCSFVTMRFLHAVATFMYAQLKRQTDVTGCLTSMQAVIALIAFGIAGNQARSCHAVYCQRMCLHVSLPARQGMLHSVKCLRSSCAYTCAVRDCCSA